MDPTTSQLETVGPLADPVRQRVYLFVRSQRDPVSREEVADGVGIATRLAAFHLEKLLSAGLLRAHYARPPGRSGPGAGRSAKWYEPSAVEIDVTIPSRHYDLAGRILTEAIMNQRRNESARAAALRVARREGKSAGAEHRAAHRSGSLTSAEKVLREYGYEPYRDQPNGVALRNCPFHSLAEQAPELVCEMNQAFIDGLLRGLGNEEVRAVLECKPGDCCVTLR